jgi:hypothetical protein
MVFKDGHSHGMTDLLEAHTLLCLHCKAYGSYPPLLQRFHGETEIYIYINRRKHIMVFKDAYTMVFKDGHSHVND